MNFNKDVLIRFLTSRHGVVYKNGKVNMKTVDKEAIVSFDGNDIYVDLTEMHPKKSSGQVVLSNPKMSEAMDMLNGLYTQIYPIQL